MKLDIEEIFFVAIFPVLMGTVGISILSDYSGGISVLISGSRDFNLIYY